MIDPKEVRIGNLVNYNEDGYGFDDYVVVIEPTEIHTRRTIAERIKHAELNPIPITPEWLERLGFVCTWSASGDGTTYEKDRISLHGDHFPLHLNGYTIPWFGMPKINHIHQLQNLYHALTGQELTVKELTPTI